MGSARVARLIKKLLAGDFRITRRSEIPATAAKCRPHSLALFHRVGMAQTAPARFLPADPTKARRDPPQLPSSLPGDAVHHDPALPVQPGEKIFCL
jgi:hypothetical protein